MSKFSTDTKGRIHADDAFLKEFIAQGGQVQTQGGSAANTDELLKEVGKGHKDATRTDYERELRIKEREKRIAIMEQREQDRLAAKQKREDEKAQREADKLARVQAKSSDDVTKAEIAEYDKQQKQLADDAKQAKSDAKKAQNAQIGLFQATGKTVKNVTDPLLNHASRTANKISNWRTVGGIGLLLIILMFLLFVVVEVNSAGDTRLKQLWYMLVGRAYLIGRQYVQKNSTTDQAKGVQQVTQTSLNVINDYAKIYNDALSNPGALSGDIGGLWNDSISEIGQTFSSPTLGF